MKVHFIAIGGTGMGATAGLMAEAGHEVRGSDGPLYPPMSTMLAALKIPVMQGYAPSTLDWQPDLVVVGNTCRADNVELVAAREHGLRCVSFPQLLSEQFLQQRQTIVVSGTHGKSTTTAMVAYVLHKAKADPSFIVGATVEQLGGPSGAGQGKHFVAEACEFDRSFLNLHPQYAAILNIEEDHLDCFRDLDAIIEAFRAFAAGLSPGGARVSQQARRHEENRGASVRAMV